MVQENEYFSIYFGIFIAQPFNTRLTLSCKLSTIKWVSINIKEKFCAFYTEK